MNKCNICLLPSVLVLMAICCCIYVSAAAPTSIPKMTQTALPQNLNFAISENCSNHVYFLQAAAREDGCFLIYSRYVNMKEPSQDNFRVAYIDLYHADGTFWQEISFNTEFDFTAELTKKAVNIYFYNTMLVYELESQSLLCYSIPDGAAMQAGINKKLKNAEFSSGNWHYRCIKGFDGYTGLVRSNGTDEFILVEMPGSGNNFWNIYFIGLVVGIAGILLLVLWRRNKTGDGLRELF